MNKDEITDRIRAVLAKELRVDPATIPATASQLDLQAWDSFCHVNVVFAVEDAFGIDLDEAEMRTGGFHSAVGRSRRKACPKEPMRGWLISLRQRT